MKKILVVPLIMALAVQIMACDSKKIIYKEGTYEGSAYGHIGTIKIKIVTDQYEIKDIKIIEQQETPVLGDIVYEKIPKRVIESNNWNVDVVAGATYTSNGLIEAIKDGLEKAKISEENNTKQ